MLDQKPKLIAIKLLTTAESVIKSKCLLFISGFLSLGLTRERDEDITHWEQCSEEKDQKRGIDGETLETKLWRLYIGAGNAIQWSKVRQIVR